MSRPEHLLDGGVQPKRESLEAAVARVLGRGHLGRFRLRFGIRALGFGFGFGFG